MKWLLAGGAAAAALVGLVPAIAQTMPSGTQPQTAPRAAKAEEVYTRAEVQAKVTEHFNRLDTNRDGFVTRAEADAARVQVRERVVQRLGERRSQRFEQIDSNNDGSISRSEWDAAAAQQAGRAATRVPARPDIQRMRGMHGIGMMAGRMFEMADSDKDGRVSLQEAQAAALRHFDMADANRDGRLTPDERRQMRRRMINERRPG